MIPRRPSIRRRRVGASARLTPVVPGLGTAATAGGSVDQVVGDAA